MIKPIELTQAQLFQVLPILSNNLHNIHTANHAHDRMEQRNVSYDDCLSIIANPHKLIDVRITDYGNYAYKIQGKDKQKHVVIAIDTAKRHIIIVTVINTRYNY